MKKFILILLFIPTTAFAAPVFEKFTSLPDPISIKEGKKLYQENGCPLCHGDEGRGDGNTLARGFSAGSGAGESARWTLSHVRWTASFNSALYR